MKEIVPVFFASDNNYAPFIAVTLESIIANASKNYEYRFYVLTTEISDEYQQKILKYAKDNIKIEFVGLKEAIKAVRTKFSLRDYYSMATYYRFFIADMFPQYDKALYLDCDICVLGDISELYNSDIGTNYIGAIQDESLYKYKPFGEYVEKALGVPVPQYFNAGILVINLKRFRDDEIQRRFVELMLKYKFRVAQDQDYLNVMCKDNVTYLDKGWNKGADETPGFDESTLKLVHYNLTRKPWKFHGIKYEEYFWEYTKKTEFYDLIKAKLDNFTDRQRANEEMGLKNLVKMCSEEAENPENYFRKYGSK